MVCDSQGPQVSPNGTSGSFRRIHIYKYRVNQGLAYSRGVDGAGSGGNSLCPEQEKCTMHKPEVQIRNSG
jgi:hypothetical protein